MTSEPNGVPWQDVEDAAAKMFRVWGSGSELEWARECWEHLGRAGLTDDAGFLETNRTYLRLVTLAKIYEEFCGNAWDENPDTFLGDLADFMEIDQIALGILAAACLDYDFPSAVNETELSDLALEAVTQFLRRDIFECLRGAYGGEVELFSRMMRTYPDREPDDDRADEFDVEAGNARALEFVMNGFR